jgi:hypothetical protein
VQAAPGEGRGGVPDAPRVQSGLPQSEQIDMADQEGGAEDHRPADSADIYWQNVGLSTWQTIAFPLGSFTA